MTAPFLPEAPWTTTRQFWDHIELNGKEVPGIATVEIERANKVDKKKAKGQHGGDKVYSGSEWAKVKIGIRILTKEAFDVFRQTILPMLEPVPGKKTPDVISIRHAVAEVRNVSAITIDKVEGPDIRDGAMEWQIDATEHSKASTEKAKGGYGQKVRYDGLQYDDQKCAILLARYNSELALAASQRGLAAGLSTQMRQATSNFASASLTTTEQLTKMQSDREAAFNKALSHDENARRIQDEMLANRCPKAPPK